MLPRGLSFFAFSLIVPRSSPGSDAYEVLSPFGSSLCSVSGVCAGHHPAPTPPTLPLRGAFFIRHRAFAAEGGESEYRPYFIIYNVNLYDLHRYFIYMKYLWDSAVGKAVSIFYSLIDQTVPCSIPGRQKKTSR